jgi:putative transposon-encoded protein
MATELILRQAQDDGKIIFRPDVSQIGAAAFTQVPQSFVGQRIKTPHANILLELLAPSLRVEVLKPARKAESCSRESLLTADSISGTELMELRFLRCECS